MEYARCCNGRHAHELVGGHRQRRSEEEQIEDVLTPQPRVERLLVAVPENVSQFVVSGPLLDLVEELVGRRGDFVAVHQQIAERAFLAGDGGVGGNAEPRHQSVHEPRIVDRHHTQGVAGLVLETAVGERELVVPDLLRGPVTRQSPIDGQRGHIGVLAIPLRTLTRGLRVRRRDIGDRRLPANALDCRQQRQRFCHPCGSGVLVVDVAVDARSDAAGAELLEPGVDHLAGLTVPVVAGVAECEHREVRGLETRRGLGRQCLPEQFRVVGHLALTVGGGDDENTLHRRQGVDLDVVECTDHRGEAVRTCRGGSIFRDALGIAGLAAVQHVDSGELPTGGGGCGGAAADRETRAHSGQEAGEPHALIVAERRVLGDVRHFHEGTASFVGIRSGRAC